MQNEPSFLLLMWEDGLSLRRMSGPLACDNDLDPKAFSETPLIMTGLIKHVEQQAVSDKRRYVVSLGAFRPADIESQHQRICESFKLRAVDALTLPDRTNQQL